MHNKHISVHAKSTFTMEKSHIKGYLVQSLHHLQFARLASDQSKEMEELVTVRWKSLIVELR